MFRLTLLRSGADTNGPVLALAWSLTLAKTWCLSLLSHFDHDPGHSLVHMIPVGVGKSSKSSPPSLMISACWFQREWQTILLGCSLCGQMKAESWDGMHYPLGLMRWLSPDIDRYLAIECAHFGPLRLYLASKRDD